MYLDYWQLTSKPFEPGAFRRPSIRAKVTKQRCSNCATRSRTAAGRCCSPALQASARQVSYSSSEASSEPSFVRRCTLYFHRCRAATCLCIWRNNSDAGRRESTPHDRGKRSPARNDIAAERQTRSTRGSGCRRSPSTRRLRRTGNTAATAQLRVGRGADAHTRAHRANEPRFGCKSFARTGRTNCRESTPTFVYFE